VLYDVRFSNRPAVAENLCSLVAHSWNVLESRCSIDRPELTTQTVQEALQVRELRLLGRRRILAHIGELLERGSDRHPRN
jgi:hypothetical protein